MSDNEFVETPPETTAAGFGRRVQLSLQGVQYDLHHWSQLPPVRDGAPALRCARYVATRNQRGPYLGFVLFVFLLLLCISIAVRSGRRR